MESDNNKENEKSGKRFRHPKAHQHLVNKLNRERGLEYQTLRKQNRRTIPAKVFTKTLCKCRLSCHLTEDEDAQRQIYQHFYSLFSWAEKTEFIQSHIEVRECKQRRKPENRKNIRFKKSFTRKYFFSDKEKRVCKSFFKQVLRISEGRLEKCVQKIQDPSVSSIVDLRGKHNAHKKIPGDKIKKVIEFINLLPQYESHYTRAAIDGRKYLSPDLNMKIIYDEYTKWVIDQNSQSVSRYMFRDIFHRKFNLKFKPPAQDTCDYCNKLNMKIKAAMLKSTERMNLLEDKINHLEIVSNLS